MSLKIGRCLGVAHTCGSSLNYCILTNIGKVITRTTVQHPIETEVQNTECRKLCRDYHARMYATIGEAVVVDLDNYNVFVSKYDMRDLMRTDNGAYYSFEKDVDVDEAVDCTRS